MPPLPPPDWPSGLPNAKIVAGDGLRIVAERISSDALRAVHVYFPDPWWKKRHKKRRVLNEPFLRDVHRAARPADRSISGPMSKSILKVRSG